MWSHGITNEIRTLFVQSNQFNPNQNSNNNHQMQQTKQKQNTDHSHISNTNKITHNLYSIQIINSIINLNQIKSNHNNSQSHRSQIFI